MLSQNNDMLREYNRLQSSSNSKEYLPITNYDDKSSKLIKFIKKALALVKHLYIYH